MQDSEVSVQPDSEENLVVSSALQIQFITSSLKRCQPLGLKQTNKIIHAHAGRGTHNLSQGHKRPHAHSHHSSRKRILKARLTKLERGGRIFSFSPRLADVFLRGRAERCRPGHFIITVRKHSVKLSQEAKEGCS